jgi:hypothetical protein
MKFKASQKGGQSEKEREMATAALSDVTDFQLAAGGEVQVLRQQLPGHPAEVLLGVAENGEAVMVTLTSAEAATLAGQLAKLADA